MPASRAASTAGTVPDSGGVKGCGAPPRPPLLWKALRLPREDHCGHGLEDHLSWVDYNIQDGQIVTLAVFHESAPAFKINVRLVLQDQTITLDVEPLDTIRSIADRVWTPPRSEPRILFAGLLFAQSVSINI